MERVTSGRRPSRARAANLFILWWLAGSLEFKKGRNRAMNALVAFNLGT